jgi:Ala-tRNA(Pro) deacylase
MPNKLLKEFLENHHVKYSSITHSQGFTAQEVAASAHVSGKQLAKIVIVKIGNNSNKLAMVVLPANAHVNFTALKDMVGVSVDLAKEADFKGKFPECELGAMPPFGNLFGMQVYASNQLGKLDQMVFSAGTHSELIRLAYQDFERLVHPKIIPT